MGPHVGRPAITVGQLEEESSGPPIIELASAEPSTVLVGAGASIESGLPSWGRLVRAVLESLAPASLGENDRAAWLDAAAEPGLLGMAATARAVVGSDKEFVKRVEHHLYDGRGPQHLGLQTLHGVPNAREADRN